MKKGTRESLRAMVLLSIMLCMSLAVTSAHSQEQMDTIGFSVRAVLPQNQRNAAGYFDLLMELEKEQVLWLEVNNHLDTPMRVRIELVDAHSNANGLIVYDAKNEGAQTDESFTKMASFRYDLLPIGEQETVQKREGNELVIAPQAMVQVPFALAPLHSPLQGQVLGGIVTMKISDGNGAQEGGFAIQNQFSYAIAVQLQTDDPVEAAPRFSAVSASLENVAGWDALRVTLKNEAPLVAAGAQLVLLVVDDEGNEVFAHTADRIAFAPQSEMPYTVLFTEEAPPAGTYRVDAALTYKGVVWNMTVPLVIP